MGALHRVLHLLLLDVCLKQTATAKPFLKWTGGGIDPPGGGIDPLIPFGVAAAAPKLTKALFTLSQKSETVSEFGDSLTFMRQCGQA